MEAIGLLGDKANVAHYDMRWLKPIDESILAEVAEKYHTIITVEDGVISGGLGSAVAEFIRSALMKLPANFLLFELSMKLKKKVKAW